MKVLFLILFLGACGVANDTKDFNAVVNYYKQNGSKF